MCTLFWALMLLPVDAMAATTLTLDQPAAITLGGSNITTQVVLPVRCRTLAVQFASNAGKVDTAGTDGGTQDASHWPVAADATLTLAVGNFGKDFLRSDDANPNVYLSSATGSTVVYAWCISDSN